MFNFLTADKVTTELTKLAKDTIPQNITSLQGIRKAMGISVESVQGTDESQPIEIEDQDENSQSGDPAQTNLADVNNQLETFTQNNDEVSFIDNEMLMETDGTMIDNL
ncbi:uncharacterized protein LOC132734762 [Ruditapes philippinarum]|uniref:uncharacterized protein LOC132734762 n=1 Tax=Ruditapes philippinarum TaxID=129788 RepID=UPI00295B7481|nr:uncharacterized protein LOC132734762 [Ruditapes philippinarum]